MARRCGVAWRGGVWCVVAWSGVVDCIAAQQCGVAWNSVLARRSAVSSGSLW